MKATIALGLGLSLMSGCGQDDGAPGLVDAASDGGCRPQTATSFSPTWKPPQAMPNDCSDAQIDDEFTRCESASATVAECTAFNRDPANARCRACLYSTEDERTYGPLVYLKNRVLSVNVAGCLALADGNLGAAGCGARLQAFESCKDAACIRSCAAFDDYQRCTTEAGNTVCLSYVDDAACRDPATYAFCLDNATFEAFYRSLAKVFCGSGFPGSGIPDGGRGMDGGVDAGAVSSWFRRIESGALRTWATGGIGDGQGR
jgi:hypothetical protein